VSADEDVDVIDLVEGEPVDRLARLRGRERARALYRRQVIYANSPSKYWKPAKNL
jgi:hypothetical protein